MLVADDSLFVTGRSTEFAECLRRLRRGPQQIRSITSRLLEIRFKARREKQCRLQGVCESIDERLEFVSLHDVSSLLTGCLWFLRDLRNPTGPSEDTNADVGPPQDFSFGVPAHFCWRDAKHR